MPTCQVGVDLGGTGSRAISVVGGKLQDAKSVRTDALGAGPVDERVDQLAQLIKNVVPKGAVLEAVGIGASGPVNVASGVINNSATLPWFTGFPLVEKLTKRLGAPVGIDNDAVAAAYGEYSIGAGAQSDRLMMVTLGTGVGVAMLVDGKPVRGAEGAHPEGGHIPIATDDVRCYCGLTGCFEQLASRTNLQKHLSDAMDGAPADPGLIAKAMALAPSDPKVFAVFAAYAAAVGRGLGSLHTLYQPRVTVIGGSAAVCFPLIRDDLVQSLVRSEGFQVHVELRAATLGNDAGAIGGALQIATSAMG